MSKVVDYYFAPQSPWTYLGHERFVKLTQAVSAQVNVRPMDLGRVFPVSGGVQLKDRPKQRQDYRIMELKRFTKHLDVPLNLHPKFFPVDGSRASLLIIAVDQRDGVDAALRLSGEIMAGVWAHEQNIADEATLSQMLDKAGLSTENLALAQSAEVKALYDQYTDEAIKLGVFGAPTYVIENELFWGQDRLDFVARALGVQ